MVNQHPKVLKHTKLLVKAGGKLEKTKESVVYRNEALRLEIVESSEPIPISRSRISRSYSQAQQTYCEVTLKKFKVYVNTGKKNADGTIKVKKVNFGHGGTSAKKAGEKTMSIRKSNPKARSSFRARHNCDTPGPKDKARYWSCRKW